MRKFEYVLRQKNTKWEVTVRIYAATKVIDTGIVAVKTFNSVGEATDYIEKITRPTETAAA